MGKASSAKKVARAARAGGSVRRDRPKLGFPLALFVIVVLGLGLVFYANQTQADVVGAATKPSSRAKDHWHAAYGFYTCDKFEPNLQDVAEDKPGIHTHNDGIMHIHPSGPQSSGDNALMKVWGSVVGVEYFNDGWKLQNGPEYRKGSAKCGDKPAKIAVYQWKVDDPTAPVQVWDSNFGNIGFESDRLAFTFAVMPEDAAEPAPKPESIGALDQLTDLEGQQPATDPNAIPQSIPTDSAPTASTPGQSTPDPSTPPSSAPAANTPAPVGSTP